MLKQLTISNSPNFFHWKWFSAKNFTSKKCYHFLLDGGIHPKFSKIIWKIKVPQKVKYFLYLSFLDKILTKSNLVKKGWKGNNNCSLCDSKEVISDHLFLQCQFSKRVWEFFHLFPHFNDLPLFQETQCNTGHAENLLQNGLALLIAIGFWCLWKERNKRYFNYHAFLPRVLALQIANLREWSRYIPVNQKLFSKFFRLYIQGHNTQV